MYKRTTIILSGIFALLLTLLTGCARTPTPLVRASWSEQHTSAVRALKDKGGDLVLVGGLARPVRSTQGAADEPVELKVLLLFFSPKSTKVNAQGVPLYDERTVQFNDHRLATTLRVDDDGESAQSPDPSSVEQAHLIEIGPQDVLQLTRKEGEAYMGQPVDRGNMTINLSGTPEKPPELKTKPVWKINFYRTRDEYLSIWVDAQTGTQVVRSEKGK